MAASKKPAKSKGSVKFKDLKTKKNPKGGAFNAYLNFVSNKSAPLTGESIVTDKTYVKISPIG
jgi:hypothetical protein